MSPKEIGYMVFRVVVGTTSGLGVFFLSANKPAALCFALVTYWVMCALEDDE